MKNLCTNPSFEAGAGGFWSGSAHQSADFAKHGTKSAKVTTTFTNGSITGGHNYLNTGSQDIITSQIGKTYIYTGWVYLPAGSPITKVNAGIRRYSNYGYLSSGKTKDLVAGQWTRFISKWLATEAIQLRFTVADPQAPAYTGSASYYVDGVRIELPPPLPSSEFTKPY